MAFQDYLSNVRKMHLRMLEAADISGGTAGTCLYACFLLSTLLSKFEREDCAVIRGGDGEGDGGYLDQSGNWRGHYWVEASSPDGLVHILDVTADQFGGPEVVCLPATHPEAARYQCGDQVVVDEHVAQFARQLEADVEC